MRLLGTQNSEKPTKHELVLFALLTIISLRQIFVPESQECTSNSLWSIWGLFQLLFAFLGPKTFKIVKSTSWCFVHFWPVHFWHASKSSMAFSLPGYGKRPYFFPFSFLEPFPYSFFTPGPNIVWLSSSFDLLRQKVLMYMLLTHVSPKQPGA